MVGRVGDLAFDEQASRDLELGDELPSRRAAFVVPPWPSGRYPEWAYFAGNSLGLMPRSVPREVTDELDGWGELAVEAWFEGEAPWLERAGSARSSIARLVGAHEDEVVVMNTLTVNLHLLLASFYRPGGGRHRILIEDAAFPSDSHAVQSQAALHGHDPREAVVRLAPRPGEATLRLEDVLEAIEREGDRLALVLLGHVNYLTGELLDMRAITAATHVGRRGERLGSRACDRQRARGAPRRGRRLRRVVPLQVRQRRAWRARRRLRPRASRSRHDPVPARGLVGGRSGRPVSHGAGLRGAHGGARAGRCRHRRSCHSPRSWLRWRCSTR